LHRPTQAQADPAQDEEHDDGLHELGRKQRRRRNVTGCDPLARPGYQRQRVGNDRQHRRPADQCEKQRQPGISIGYCAGIVHTGQFTAPVGRESFIFFGKTLALPIDYPFVRDILIPHARRHT